MTRSRSTEVVPPPETEGLVDALVQTAFTTMAVLTRVAADNDLSLTQLRVLAILRDRSAGVTALANYLGLEKSTMSGLVDRAEKRGLLQRASGEGDGRSVHVSISPAGRKLAGRLYARIESALLPTIEILGMPERARLRAILEKMLGRSDDDIATEIAEVPTTVVAAPNRSAATRKVGGPRAR